jgi:hypothetical protein
MLDANHLGHSQHSLAVTGYFPFYYFWQDQLLIQTDYAEVNKGTHASQVSQAHGAKMFSATLRETPGSTQWNYIDIGKLLFRQPELSDRIRITLDKLVKEMVNLAIQSIFVHTFK